MGKATRVMGAGRRLAVWLLPAWRRDWAAAVWAEAHEVPPGLARLSWLAGGAWVLAREALLLRRFGRAVLFAAAACVAVWATWPRPWVGHVAEGRFNAIAPVLLVAGLPLLSRRLFGPVSPGRLARSLRVLCCAAVLALVAASTVLLVFNMLAPTKPAYLRIFCGGQGCARVVPGRSSGGPTWQGEILVMLLVIGYVGVTLFLLMLMSFPVIGLFMGSLAAVIVNPAPSSSGSPGNGGGPPGPGPGPGSEPPGGGRAKSDRVPVPVLSGCTVFCPPHVRSPRSGLPTTDGE